MTTLKIEHSRFNRNHYINCKRCYEDYIDFKEQCRIDEQDDIREIEADCED